MRVVVLSCEKYSDAWKPFYALFRKFWPECPYDVWHVTDHFAGPVTADVLTHNICTHDSSSWNEILAAFCSKYDDEPIMLFLEDYFLTSTPNQALIDHALDLFHKFDASCVRLYPCPGGVADIPDPYFAGVPFGEPYRISTQVAIWDSIVLKFIAENTKSPQEFELLGSKSFQGGGPIFAFKRDVQPWPLEYICTAIVRGVWQQGALDWCQRQGIPVDTSRRPIASTGIIL